MQWFRFYSEALDDPKVQRLPGDLFKVWVNLLCLANESDKRGHLPSVEDIAFRLRMSEPTAQLVLAQLAERGLLESDGDTFHPHNWAGRQKPSDNVTARVQKHRAKGADTETLQKRSGNALEENRVEKSREEENRPAPSSPPRPLRPDPSPPSGGGKVRAVPKPSTLNVDQKRRFDTWYSGYPNKQHRPEAERAWAKLDPDAEMMGRLIGDVLARTKGRKWREGYIEHPATYLNNRVWEDDIEPMRAVPARASPNGQQQSNEQAKFQRSIAALQGVGGHRGPADIPEEHGEIGGGLLGRGHAGEGRGLLGRPPRSVG